MDKTIEKSKSDNDKKEEKKEEEEEEEKREEFGSFAFWMYAIIGAVLASIAGLMSGLTVGYLSIDELVLELKIKNGTEEEKKQV